MPTTVENRVVEMEFDNKRFEANVKETMTSIEKLKEALTFKGLKSGFDEIEQNAKKLNLSPLEKSVDTVKDKFSAMEIVAISALMRITNQAMATGERLVKSLTIDQATAGFDKYAEKTQAVQVIMNATGKSIEEVDEQLEKLAWFTDETSYSFLDMVNNIGKFTSNSVDLETAVTAMQGISTWAAKSGANVQEASRAMYNLSQAIATGSVKLIDWKSIENANMATAEFKQTVIDTAIGLGTLKKASDGTITTLKGNLVSARNFNEALKDSWFTSDVLLKSLDRYGNFTNKLFETTEKTGLSASQVLAAIDSFKEGTLDLSKFSDDLETSVEDTTKYIAELSDDAYDFGRKAFQAAQEAKTFKEAIDATKDAVSSGWMKTFEIIFGNYKEAVKLWTSVANIMYEIFAGKAYDRNKMLETWKELGGRGALLDTVSNSFMALWSAIKPIREAFRDIFPEMTAERLYEMTVKLRDFTSHLKISDVTAQNLRDAFKGLFTVFKQIGTGFVDLIRKGKPVFALLGALVRLFIALAGAAGRWAQKQEVINKIFSVFVKVVKAGLTVVFGLVYAVITLVSKMAELGAWLDEIGVFKVITTPIQILAGAIVFLYQSIRNLLGLSLREIPAFIQGIDAKLTKLANDVLQFPVVQKTLTFLTGTLESIQGLLSKIGEKVAPVWDFFKEVGELISQGKWQEAFTLVADKLKDITESLKTMITDGLFGGFKDENGNVMTAKEKLEQFNNTLKAFRENLSIGKIVALGFSIMMLTLAASVTRLADSTRGVMDSLKNLITSGNKIMRALATRTAPVRQFAEAIAIVAGSLALLSLMDQEKLKSSAKYIAGIMATLATFAVVITLLSRGSMKHDFRDFSKNINTIAISVISLAAGVLALTLAMRALEGITVDAKIFAKIAIIGVLMAGLVAAGVALAKFAPKLSAGGLILVLYALSVKKIVEALVAFNEIDVTGLSGKVVSLISLMSGLAILAMGMGQIKLSSVLGVLLLAATFKMLVPIFRDEILPAVNEFGNSFMALTEKLAQTLRQIIGAKNTMKLLQTMSNDLRKTAVATIVSFSGLMATIAIFGKSMKNIGKGIGYFGLGLSVVLLSIGGLISIMSKVEGSWAIFEQIQNFLRGILVSLTIMIAIAAVFSGTNLKKMGVTLGGSDSIFGQFAKMLKSLSFLFVSILAFSAIATVIASGENRKAFVLAASTVLLMLDTIAIIVGASAFAGQHGGADVLKQVKNIAYALDLIMALIVVVSAVPQEDITKAEYALIAVTGLFMLLIVTTGVVNKSTTTIKQFTSNASMAVLAIGGVLAIAGAIIAITRWSESMGAAAGAMGILIGVLVGLAATITVANNFVKDSKKFRKTATTLLIATSMLAVIALSIIALTKWSKNMGAAAGAMGILIGMLTAITTAVVLANKFSKDSKKFQRTATSLLIASASLIVIAASIALLTKSTENMGDAAAAMGILIGVFSAMAIALGMLDNFSKSKTSLLAVAGAMDLMALSFIAIAKSLLMLEKYDATDMQNKLNAMATVVGVMSLLVGLLGAALGGSGVGWIAIAGIIAIAAAIDLLTLSFLIAAQSLKIAMNVLYKLPEFLETMAAIPSEDISNVVTAVIAMSEALKKLAVAGFMLNGGSVGLTIGAAGILVLANGLVALGEVTISPSWLDFIAEALKTLAVAGVALTIGSPGLLAGGLGLKFIASGIEAIDETGMDPSTVEEYAKSFSAFATTGVAMAVAAPGMILAAVGIKAMAASIDELAVSSANLNDSEVYAVEGMVERAASPKTQSALKLAGASFALPFLMGAYNVWGQHSPWTTTEDSVDYATVGMANGVSKNESKMSTLGKFFGSPFMQAFVKVMTSTATTAVDGSVTAVQTGVNEAKPALKEAGSEAGESVASGFIGTVWNNIKGFFSKLNKTTSFGVVADGITGFAEEAKKKFKEEGFTGVFDLGTKKIDEYVEKISGSLLGDNMFDGVKSIQEEFGLMISDSMDAMKDLTDATGSASDAYGDLGDSATKTKTFVEQLTDTIEQQMDVFTEFNSKTEVTGEQMLNNMASQVSGVRQWAENLKYLAERGIDDGLLQKLTELGPAGYEKVAAFVNMTDEQLQMAGTLFKESLSLPESTSKEVSKDWWTTGEEAAESFSSGVSSEKSKSSANESAKTVSNEVVNGIKAAIPQFVKIGEDTVKNLGKGVASEKSKSDANSSAKTVSKEVQKGVTATIPQFVKIGQQVSVGLGNGIESKTSEVTTKAGISASSVLNTYRKVLGIASPSKETFKIGQFFVEGFILGLLKSGTLAKKETENSAIGLIDAFNQTLNSNYDIATFSPTVRPVLDLTSFDQDYSKFSSIMDAGYSKSLSGSMHTYASFDDSLLNALENLGDNSDVVEEVRSLSGRIADMTQQIGKMQVVLDSGTMVGALVTPLDQALGNKAIRSRRERR